jgi:hypothetical protein
MLHPHTRQCYGCADAAAVKWRKLFVNAFTNMVTRHNRTQKRCVYALVLHVDRLLRFITCLISFHEIDCVLNVAVIECHL